MVWCESVRQCEIAAVFRIGAGGGGTGSLEEVEGKGLGDGGVGPKNSRQRLDMVCVPVQQC